MARWGPLGAIFLLAPVCDAAVNLLILGRCSHREHIDWILEVRDFAESLQFAPTVLILVDESLLSEVAKYFNSSEQRFHVIDDIRKVTPKETNFKSFQPYCYNSAPTSGSYESFVEDAWEQKKRGQFQEPFKFLLLSVGKMYDKVVLFHMFEDFTSIYFRDQFRIDPYSFSSEALWLSPYQRLEIIWDQQTPKTKKSFLDLTKRGTEEYYLIDLCGLAGVSKVLFLLKFLLRLRELFPEPSGNTNKVKAVTVVATVDKGGVLMLWNEGCCYVDCFNEMHFPNFTKYFGISFLDADDVTVSIRQKIFTVKQVEAPFAAEINLLFAGSNDFIGCASDWSLTKALSNNKIPLYYVRSAKRGFVEVLKQKWKPKYPIQKELFNTMLVSAKEEDAAYRPPIWPPGGDFLEPFNLFLTTLRQETLQKRLKYYLTSPPIGRVNTTGKGNPGSLSRSMFRPPTGRERRSRVNY